MAIITLEATSITFFSEIDEQHFFEWLDKIKAVRGYKGQGLTLYIKVKYADVDGKTLLEFLALFKRYGIEFKQLKIFDKPEFADWFRDERAYWFNAIFGKNE